MPNSNLQKPFFIPGQMGDLEAIIDCPKSGNFEKSVNNLSQPICIICHPHPLYQGTMDNKVVVTISKAFNQLGLETLRFNYRGVGQSEGFYGNGSGELEDCESVLEWVKSHYPDRPIWLAGFSFGGYIAYQSAALFFNQFNIQTLLTVAPGITRFENIENTPEPPESIYWAALHSSSDEIVESNIVFNWLINHKRAVDIIKLSNTSHFFHGKLKHLKEIILRCFEGRTV